MDLLRASGAGRATSMEGLRPEAQGTRAGSDPRAAPRLRRRTHPPPTCPAPGLPLPLACRFSLASIMLAEPSIFESYVYGAQWMMRPFK